MKYVPNILSVSRILVSVALIFVPVFSPAFCVLYVLAGISDMLDGFIARRYNACTKLGSIIDSIADFVFVAVCLYKILPALTFPLWLYLCVALIAAIKLSTFVLGFILYHKPCMLHTIPNKIAGFVLFVLPLFLVFFDIKYCAIPAVAVAFAASIHEAYLVEKGSI